MTETVFCFHELYPRVTFDSVVCLHMRQRSIHNGFLDVCSLGVEREQSNAKQIHELFVCDENGTVHESLMDLAVCETVGGTAGAAATMGGAVATTGELQKDSHCGRMVKNVCD